MCRVVRVGVGRVGLDGYQPGVYVPLKALFLVLYLYLYIFISYIYFLRTQPQNRSAV